MMADTSTLQDIIKTKEIIKKKLMDLKRGVDEREQLLSETFKPIVTPLTNLKTSLEKLQQPVVKTEQQKVHDDNEVFETPVKKIKYLKPMPLFIKDEETFIESPTASPTQDIHEQFETKEELEQSTQNILGKIAGKYMALYAIKSPQLDNVYGIRLDPNTKKFMMGDSEVEIDKNDIKIGDTWYEGTTGLYELLTLKVPNPKKYDENDKITYQEIVKKTNAHRKHHSRLGSIIFQPGIKYKNIIREIIPHVTTRSHSKPKSGGKMNYPELNVTNKRTQYLYWTDPNKLVKRLMLLLASKHAGHTGHDDEIMRIEEALRDAQIII